MLSSSLAEFCFCWFSNSSKYAMQKYKHTVSGTMHQPLLSAKGFKRSDVLMYRLSNTYPILVLMEIALRAVAIEYQLLFYDILFYELV